MKSIHLAVMGLSQKKRKKKKRNLGTVSKQNLTTMKSFHLAVMGLTLEDFNNRKTERQRLSPFDQSFRRVEDDSKKRNLKDVGTEADGRVDTRLFLRTHGIQL